MMWNRERYIAHCHFEDTGREMFCELFGPLIQVEDEWKQQGATEKEIGMTAFDWDYVPTVFLAGNAFAVTGKESVVLEDTSEYIILMDHYGRKLRGIKKMANTPLPFTFPVETMDDWLKIKHWYEFSEERIDREKLLQQKKLRDKGYLTLMNVPGGFDEPRQLLGEENLCIAYYDEPEMIHDMLETMADNAIKIMERVGDIVPIDNLFIHEDMAGKSGPLAGPNIVDEFISPYYKKVCECAKAYGATLFSQDSDGYMNPVMDNFLDCGINCFHPCEPAAGMDMVEIHRKYGKRLCIKGGIDKFALLKGKEEIRKELEYKMSSSMRGGGIIFGLDHRIPNGVTLENYKYYVKLGREILGLEPISGEGWGRMAF